MLTYSVISASGVVTLNESSPTVSPPVRQGRVPVGILVVVCFQSNFGIHTQRH